MKERIKRVLVYLVVIGILLFVANTVVTIYLKTKMDDDLVVVAGTGEYAGETFYFSPCIELNSEQILCHLSRTITVDGQKYYNNRSGFFVVEKYDFFSYGNIERVNTIQAWILIY